MKLRILLDKVTADFLSEIKASVNIALTATPMTMTYELDLSSFRNAVNQKYPPQVGTSHPYQPTRGAQRRHVRELNTGGRGRGNRGRGRRGYGGHGGRGGGGRGRGVYRTVTSLRCLMVNRLNTIRHSSFHRTSSRR